MDFFEQHIGLIEKNENIHLIKGTGENLPLNSNTVDYVFCTNVIDHCSDPNKVVGNRENLENQMEYFCPPYT